jgi:hypothetical protein
VSAAEAGWLVDQDEARFDVQPGSVMVVTEGSKVVAYFHVESVQEGVRSRSAQAH